MSSDKKTRSIKDEIAKLVHDYESCRKSEFAILINDGDAQMLAWELSKLDRLETDGKPARVWHMYGFRLLSDSGPIRLMRQVS